MDSQRMADTYMQLNKMLRVIHCWLQQHWVVWYDNITWLTLTSHETHLQQSGNNAHCENKHWLQSFEMWSAQQTITPPQISSSESEVPPTLGGMTYWEATEVDEGKNNCCHNALPRDIYSRVWWSVRTDGSQEKMGGNVWCPTMPISYGRRFKGQGVEVRNYL